MSFGYPPRHKPPTPVPHTIEALREELNPDYAPRPITDTDLPTRLSTTALNATYARFVDENGNPLAGKHVVIKVDSTTGEILDIVAEA